MAYNFPKAEPPDAMQLQLQAPLFTAVLSLRPLQVGRREMEEWARSNLDVWEDTSGQTLVKDLTFIEVQWGRGGGGAG